ncbi:MAG: hypothetical protein ACFB21_08455 [Opitutales bacterium]
MWEGTDTDSVPRKLHKFVFRGALLFIVAGLLGGLITMPQSVAGAAWASRFHLLLGGVMLFGFAVALIGIWESRKDPQYTGDEQPEKLPQLPAKNPGRDFITDEDREAYLAWLAKDPARKHLSHRQKLEAFRATYDKDEA